MAIALTARPYVVQLDVPDTEPMHDSSRLWAMSECYDVARRVTTFTFTTNVESIHTLRDILDQVEADIESQARESAQLTLF